jgi:mannosyl-3-phosphoglycerate phosphatase
VGRIIFTDLDGTLLDFDTYRPAKNAVELLSNLDQAGVRVVPATSKTAAEVRPLMAELGLPGPAVVEGGGVLARSDGVDQLMGAPRADLIGILERLQNEAWPVRGMSQMSVGEVVELTGLSTDGARRAMIRQASEPFIFTHEMPSEKLDELARTIAQVEAGVVRGGRFWHLLGAGVDKGGGVRVVVESGIGGDRPATAAVGDAWNDLAMFEAVDHAYLLGNEVASADVPAGVVRIGESGPEGFSKAVHRVLDLWR